MASLLRWKVHQWLIQKNSKNQVGDLKQWRFYCSTILRQNSQLAKTAHALFHFTWIRDLMIFQTFENLFCGLRKQSWTLKNVNPVRWSVKLKKALIKYYASLVKDLENLQEWYKQCNPNSSRKSWRTLLAKKINKNCLKWCINNTGM